METRLDRFIIREASEWAVHRYTYGEPLNREYDKEVQRQIVKLANLTSSVAYKNHGTNMINEIGFEAMKIHMDSYANLIYKGGY